MNTVEVAIEQLLAGTLALLVFLLPIAGIPPTLAVGNTVVAIGFLGLGYLLGVVMDKTSDRILGGLDRFHVHRAVHRPTEKGGDPNFQPDRAELFLRMQDKESVDRWMVYLRTRVRIARVVAVFVPLLGLSIAAWASLPEGCGTSDAFTPSPWLKERGRCLEQAGWQAFGPLLAYASVFMVCLLPWSRLPHDSEAKDKYFGEGARREWCANLLRAVSPIGLLYGCCVVGSWGLLDQRWSPNARLLIIGSPMMFGLAGLWSWWAVLGTYRTFLNKAENTVAKSSI